MFRQICGSFCSRIDKIFDSHRVGVGQYFCLRWGPVRSGQALAFPKGVGHDSLIREPHKIHSFQRAEGGALLRLAEKDIGPGNSLLVAEGKLQAAPRVVGGSGGGELPQRDWSEGRGLGVQVGHFGALVGGQIAGQQDERGTVHNQAGLEEVFLSHLQQGGSGHVPVHLQDADQPDQSGPRVVEEVCAGHREGL